MQLNVTLPDGKVLQAPAGSSTASVAAMIGAGLARNAVAGKVTASGETAVYDLHRPLPGDCQLSILTASDENEESLLVLRHSAAHVMAEALCKLFPETKLAYGPPLEDGFYYDIDLKRSITPDDFARIEAEMQRIIKEDRPFTRYDMPRGDAMGKLAGENNRYKIDNAERAVGDSLSFYVTGANPGRDFEDLCRGPHIPSTGLIKAFRIKQVSGSYYRGDVNDQPLQRVYGTAFFKKSSMDAYFTQLEEAKKRDHRVLGRELDLFTITDAVGGGLVLWMPRGAIIRSALQEFLSKEMVRLGYDLIYTPHIGQLGLYRCSGHYPYYEDSQFPAMYESSRGKAIQSCLQLAKVAQEDKGPSAPTLRHAVTEMLNAVQTAWGKVEALDTSAPLERIAEVLYAALEGEQGFLLRPMNCPHHIQIYASRQRSYRDLPVRLAEYGTVYRYEQSGEISGLTRVRGFTQDDAHLFCTSDQLADELLKTVDLTKRVLDVLGLTDYRVRLGLRDPASDKYIGSDENWHKAESAIRAAAVASGMSYSEETGEAAFYGPKIDFVVRDCIGRKWQLGTVQVDYNLPLRFKLEYVGADNRMHTPVMIHRAPFGSMERFCGILIEHFAGAFPLWLSPVQVGVASVSEKSEAYAATVADELRAAGLRVELDISAERIGPKKQHMRAQKYNYILVVGEKEAEDRTVNVNTREGGTTGSVPVAQFISACHAEIDEMRLPAPPVQAG